MSSDLRLYCSVCIVAKTTKEALTSTERGSWLTTKLWLHPTYFRVHIASAGWLHGEWNPWITALRENKTNEISPKSITAWSLWKIKMAATWGQENTSLEMTYILTPRGGAGRDAGQWRGLYFWKSGLFFAGSWLFFSRSWLWHANEVINHRMSFFALFSN